MSIVLDKKHLEIFHDILTEATKFDRKLISITFAEASMYEKLKAAERNEKLKLI